MRAHLTDKKLDPPKTLIAGKLRIQQLEHEIKEIDTQVQDPDRRSKFSSHREFVNWLTRAKNAQSWLRRELAQLEAWVAAQQQSAQLTVEEEKQSYADFWRE
jgi:hypothetical protein